eukprot:m51a1_g13120 hypothetical protein (282) ;mRNA; f:221-1066
MADLQGRTFLVTGSTDGIGRHTAVLLARAGARVLVHGRSPDACERALADVRSAAASGGAPEPCAIVADLSSLSAVRALAGEARARCGGRLDALVNNAGCWAPRLLLTADGLESTFQVHVAAPWLLACLLRGALRASGPRPRVVNVSSISHGARVELADLRYERRGYEVHEAYSAAKTAVLQATAGMAARMPWASVCAIDPGTVNTKMLLAGWGPCGCEVCDAGDEFWAATDERVGASTGGYYVDRRPARPCSHATDPQACQQLWSLLERVTGETWPSDVPS